MEPPPSRPLRVFFDINVLLDLLLEREPFARAAAELLGEVERGRLGALVSGDALTTVYYLISRARSPALALVGIERLLRLVEVAPVGRPEAEAAVAAVRAGLFDDFEDAAQYAAAEHARADALLTRDPAGFAGVSLPVYSPTELLALLAT